MMSDEPTRCPFGHSNLLIRPFAGELHCQHCNERYNSTVCPGFEKVTDE